MSFVIMILVAPALMLGFTVAGCLAANISQHAGWMAGAGLGVCLVLPVILASWVRSMRRAARVERREQDGVSRPVQPSGFPSGQGTVLLFNLLVLAGSALLAPDQTRTGLTRQGAWWARELATLLPPARGEALVMRVEAITRWLAEKAIPRAPGEAGAAPAGRAGDTDGGRPLAERPPADAGSTRQDGALDPTAGDEVHLAFERQGTGIVVPVRLMGPTTAVTVRMLFDTGATLTTINEETLRRLGLALDPDAPRVLSQTANGQVHRPITVLDGAALGAAAVEGGLTVAICDPCASGSVVGLLGLNFARHFRVTVDHETGTLTLQPKLQRQSRLHDIQHFVKLRGARGVWTGSLLNIHLMVDNRSPRALRDVQVQAEVTQDSQVSTLQGAVAAVPARSAVPLSLQGVMEVKGERFLLKLTGADW